MTDDSRHARQFGFKPVDPDQKTDLVQQVFGHVAFRYDLMNDLMSLALHRYWKKHLLQLIPLKPYMNHLDMAGGTGDVAYKVIDRMHQVGADGSVILCDLNMDMLLQSQKKPFAHSRAKLMCANAEILPFPDDYFDGYTISFGLRNVTHIGKVLEEAYRVLKPSGQFLCLEFSKVTTPMLSFLYRFYTLKVIPRLGKIVANDEEAYAYLGQSIDRFMSAFALKQNLERVGFKRVSYTNLSKGIVAIHCGWKG